MFHQGACCTDMVISLGLFAIKAQFLNLQEHKNRFELKPKLVTPNVTELLCGKCSPPQ